MTVCGPWPEWDPHPVVLLVVCSGLVALARPAGKQWWPWVAVLLSLAAPVLQPAGRAEPQRLGAQLDAHCTEMLAVAEDLAEDPRLNRLLAASGEAFRPELPFEVLRRQLGGREGRTLFLADDRNRLVAWAGLQRSFPSDLRPLGERRWGISWSTQSATLYVREPLLLEGRLVGAVTVADREPLVTEHAWGMEAGRGIRFRLGQDGGEAIWLRANGKPAVELVLTSEVNSRARDLGTVWIGWLLLAVLALVLRPAVAWAVVLVGTAAYLFVPGPAAAGALVVALLAGSAAVNRLARQLPPFPARLLVVGVVLAAVAATLLVQRWQMASWLPSHLVKPGWGGVWMVVVAWLVAAWPAAVGSTSQPLSLSRRLMLAVGLSAAGVLLGLARVPIELYRTTEVKPQVSLPRGQLDLTQLLPVAAVGRCRLDDLAPLLASRWHLDHWRTPSELLVLDSEGVEISRWGDLQEAEESARLLRSWSLHQPQEVLVELWVATEPWSLLADWRPGDVREASWTSNVWYAVLTRSGTVEASRHPQIRNLEPAVAGDLFYKKGGWTVMTVGESRRPARIRRHGNRLVAVVARPSSPSVWAVRAALACVWALLGLTVALPPAFRWEQSSTFGGRLRLLVAGGVVLPLVILTLFLQQRLRREEVRLQQVMGYDALRTARYTAVHLAGGFAVDDELARWLSVPLGGEVVLFDGAQLVAVSRPDLLVMGILPELPAAEVFPRFQLGRNDPIVLHQLGHLTAVGAVQLQGRRLLLQVFPVDPLQTGESPEAVDWLLTGAVLAALLALVLTSRVERRLSTSLDDLVALARRLQSGEPVGQVRQPQESDLAEVLDAVRLMSEEVQQREQSLRLQEELLRITLSTLAPAVLVLDSEQTVRFANPSGSHLLEVNGDRVHAWAQELGGRCLPGQAPVIETIRPLPGAELTWRIGVAGVPLPDGSRGLVVVVDDVTDVVRVDRLRQLNQLARIVAHEVKNPLTPVRLWVQELQEAQRRNDPELVPLLAEACQEISVQVERLQTMASSFSNLAALESWEPQEVDLAELAAEVTRGLAVLRRRGVLLESTVPAAGVATVVGDRQWLRRALDNLIKNSVDALADEGGTISLRITGGKANENRVVVEVEDSAGGVPPEELKDLFSPSFSTTSTGSGLGLALVHQVVIRCQGRVAAENGEQGLVVRLELPHASGTITP